MNRFIVDNQLSVALARWFEARGSEAVHVLDLNMGQASDTEIWRYAAETDTVIVSKDEDFAQLTMVRPDKVSVVWLRVGNCRTADLIRTMDRIWPQITIELDGGARLVEVS